MKRYIAIAALTAALGTADVLGQARNPDAPLGFFVSSEQNTGNLGGLAGADAICQRLAAAVGAGNRTWRAYLSISGTPTTPAVNARDRIGNGPWYNANGVKIADNVADLHGDVQRNSNLLFLDTAVTERGEIVTGRKRPEGVQNEHEILTGSDSHGRALPVGIATQDRGFTCNNWTSDSDDYVAMVGHHDLESQFNTSWNASHTTGGCSVEELNDTGGVGHVYCFASN